MVQRFSKITIWLRNLRPINKILSNFNFQPEIIFSAFGKFHFYEVLSVIRLFFFLTLFHSTFCDLVQNEEFRALLLCLELVLSCVQRFILKFLMNVNVFLSLLN